MRLTKLLLGHAFLVASSLALLFGSLEILVLTRVLDFRFVLGTTGIEPWNHPDNRLDPKLLHIRKPYLRVEWEGVEYRYDRNGLRNEMDLDSAEVVVVGDSIVEGWGVSHADLITTKLARRLGRPVANVAQSWYGPQQELELLRRYGIPLRPKTCVWVFFEGNDLQDVSRYESVTANWDEFAATLNSFWQRSFTRNAFGAVNDLARSPARRRDERIYWEKRSGSFVLASGERVRIDFLNESHPLSPEGLESLEVVRRSLSRANDLCRGVGAKLLVTFAPTTFRVYRDYTQFAPDAVPRTWVVNDLPERLAAIVRELPEVLFLDLTPYLAARARQGSLVYFPIRDTHWSPEGHLVAASAIAGALGGRESGQDLPGVP